MATKKKETTKKKEPAKKKTPTRSRKKAPTKAQSKKQSILIYELKLVALVTVSVILGFALHTNAIGLFGVIAKKVAFGLFANAGYCIPYVLFVLVFVHINHNLDEVRVKYSIASIFLFVSVILLVTTYSYDLIAETLKFNQTSLFSSDGVSMSFSNGIDGHGGGVLGNWITFAIVGIFGKVGAYIIALCLLAGTFILGTRTSVSEMIEKQKQAQAEKQAARKEAVLAAAAERAASQQMTIDDVPAAVEKPALKSRPPVSDKPSLMKKISNFKVFDSANSLDDLDEKPKSKDMSQEKVKAKEVALEADKRPVATGHVPPKPKVSDLTITPDPVEETPGPQIKFNDFTLAEEPVKETEEKEDDKPLTKAEEKAIIEAMDENNKPAYEDYVIPSTDMLKINTSLAQSTSKDDLLEKAKLLEQTLQNFGVDAKVVQVSQGPTITMYELQPSPGVKVSKIVGLSDDIALNLAATHVRVAPIPGKVAVGIEVPNESTSMVMMRDVVETKEFKSASSKLSFALGKDISGKPIIGDLAKMPHMLIAGATGSGKSVCVNTIINSILFNSTPDEVKLLMIDPKVVELSNYNGIPHLILPVVTDPKKAAIALNWAVQEMTRRYQLFAETSVKDMKGYNVKADKINAQREADAIKAAEEAAKRAAEKASENSGEAGDMTNETAPSQDGDVTNQEAADVTKITIDKMEKLPQIVVIIDELADLMMVAASAVEDAICRLAQMARAAGIHLIVATQRPSVDVITGLIKANIPSRIAFAVSSQTDSRTIIDMGGAEKLLGKGDMLYYPVGESKPKRIQGAFISEEETEEVVEFVKAQAEGVVYREEILESSNAPSGLGGDDDDEHLKEAIEVVVHAKSASVSMLQRKFRVGYNRAARMIDEMESRGIVGPSQGSKARTVLITPEELEEVES